MDRAHRSGPAPTWDDVLASVATGGQRLVLETSDGRRAVLLAESELVHLEQMAARQVVDRESDGACPLTAREAEVLALVATGLSGSEVAGRLGLAPNTVAQHLAAVRRAFGVGSTAAAVAAARATRAIPVDHDPAPGNGLG